LYYEGKKLPLTTIIPDGVGGPDITWQGMDERIMVLFAAEVERRAGTGCFEWRAKMIQKRFDKIQGKPARMIAERFPHAN